MNCFWHHDWEKKFIVNEWQDEWTLYSTEESHRGKLYLYRRICVKCDKIEFRYRYRDERIRN